MKLISKSIQISGMAACVPKNIFCMDSLVGEFGKNDVLNTIRTTGIKEIRFADAGVTASDLCIHAAEKLFEEYKINRNEIDGLIFVSQSPDFKMPATSFILQSKLGLNNNTACFDLPYGCSGYIYGLFQATMLIESGVCNKIILLVGDTTTKMINSKDRSVKMVFGDAGTATLIEKGRTTIGLNMKVDGTHYNQLIIPAGGYRYPSSNLTSEVVEVENNNYRSQEDLFMDGMGILKFAITEVPPLISESLQMAHWKYFDVDTCAIHQANEFMVNYLRKILKLDKNQVPIHVERFGNTGPASIPLLLCSLGEELREQNKLERVLMCGFGVGLSLGAAYANLTLCNFIKPFDYEG